MDLKAFEKVKNDYYIKREKKIREAEQKKEDLLENNLAINQLESKRNMIALKIARSMLSNIDVKQMEKELKDIDKQINDEYARNGIDKKMFLPEFDCKKCNDTGIITDGNETKYCSCFVQAVINETYKQLNMMKINEENFNTFDIGYYSNKVDKEKYGSSKSPRENIENIMQISINFASNINSEKEKSLLFIGKTGLGKTFLSNSIAKMVVDQGYSVIYQTAPIFMDQIMQYKFSYDDEKKELYNRIFDVDLLIIDDLGTENITDNKYAELFNVINTRLLKNKKMIISTNLTLNELFSRYDERIISRLIGEFKICKFIGEDIRLNKKRISQDIIKK